MSKWQEQRECPRCHKDNLAVYDDHEHCFTMDCDYHKNYNEEGRRLTKERSEDRELTPLPVKECPPLKERGIDSSTINKYKVTTSIKTGPVEAIFPRFDEEGKHIANQIRLADKDFRCEGLINKATLFGQQAFPAGGLAVTVTEGYYDTLSAFQLTGSRFANVGVMSASTAKKEVVRNFEYLDAFDRIVLNFDNDEPGQKAAKECAQLFAPGKVHILCLQKAKDANDYLQNGWGKEYVNEWHRAPAYMPDGLLLGNNQELIEEIVKYKDPPSIPYPWEGLNHKTYGMRTSEFVLLMADTGVGKTSVFKEIEYSLLTNPQLIAENAGVGFLHLEEPKRHLAMGLLSVHKSKPYHFPDVERSEEELRTAYKEVLDTDRVVIWDHFGSNDIDVVLSKIRHMAALGCRYIFVDHLSIIVSDQEGDERKQLDEISTKLKTLTMNLDINVHCVIHTNRKGEARGSAGPEQVSNIILRLERDIKSMNDWRRNITRLTVEKNRPFGRTGPACWLEYDEVTGRLRELSKELVYEYENGGSGAGHEFQSMSA